MVPAPLDAAAREERELIALPALAELLGCADWAKERERRQFTVSGSSIR